MVNFLGCLFLGFLASIMEDRFLFSPEFRVFTLIGLLGGFTTFSTFGYETMTFFQNSQILFGIGNILLHIGFGLLGVCLGQIASKLV